MGEPGRAWELMQRAVGEPAKRRHRGGAQEVCARAEREGDLDTNLLAGPSSDPKETARAVS